MSNQLHYVHFLIQTTLRRKRGWVAPAELPGNKHHGGNFAIPVDKYFKPFEKYNIDIARIREGQPISVTTYSVVKSSNLPRLTLSLTTPRISFIASPWSGRWQPLPYIGELSHADFAYRFIEIETEGEDDADRLYDKYKMVLVGCHPFSKYVGIDDEKGDGHQIDKAGIS